MYLNQNNLSPKQCILQGFIYILPFIWLATGMLLSTNGESYMNGICLFSSIIILVCEKKTPSILNTLKKNPVLYIHLCLLIYGIFSYFYHGYSSRELKALFFSFLYLSLFPYKNYNKKIFLYLVLLAAIAISSLAGYNFFSDINRIGKPLNPNVFAPYAAIFSLFCLCCSLWSKNLYTRTIYFILFILTAIAVTLTLTRGALLPFYLIVTSVFIYFVCYLTPRKILTSLFVLFTLTILYSIFNEFAASRMLYLVNEVQLMLEGRLDSSPGYRFQLWRSALSSIFKQPIFGLGDLYKTEFLIYYQNGLITETLLQTKDIQAHYHNQFLDKLVKNGVVGLVLLMTLFITPIYLARKNNIIAVYQACLITMISMLTLYSLVEAPLNHSIIIYTYLFITTLILSHQEVE